MRSRFSTVILLGVAACGEVVKQPPDAMSDGPAGDTMSGPAAECRAQRVVHLVGGQGGFAWFTLLWPLPAVITGFQPTYAYDAPTNAAEVTTDPAHRLFARRLGAQTVWQGAGAHPNPSAFVAGANETHTQQPSSIVLQGGAGLLAAAATIQTSLAPKIAVIQFSPAGPYGAAPGAPSPVAVTSVDAAINAFQGLVTPQVQQQLSPTAAQLASYVPPNATLPESDFATRLAFTANAFRLGVLGSVILPALNDDPHGAFTNGNVTQRANNLAQMLDAFYRDLAASSELECGRGGNFLSLADNVVMIINGDTPKNSFDNAGWPDGTIQGANWVYVRSNGFTRPGWFGQITPAGRTNFNPSTGALDAATPTTSATAAAWAGALYAIARGDMSKVTPFTNAPFGGVIQP